MKFSSSFFEAQHVSMCGVIFAWPRTFRHVLSTLENRLASSGSWCWMSGLLKMGSRYIHCRCRASHSSTTSLTVFSCCSHSVISSSKGFLYGEKLMDWDMTMWSSSCWTTCSSTRMT